MSNATCDNVGTNPDDICPLGCICDDEGNGYNCTILQEKWGVVLDGIYCPPNTTYVKNCPVGYFCPNAETKVLCPKGYFCPHKTKIQEIPCARCDKGATEFQRDLYGYITFILAWIVVICFVIVRFIRKRKANTESHKKKLQDRLMTSERKAQIRKKERQRIEKLSPKLKDIFGRIGLVWVGDNRFNLESIENTEKIFYAIDTNGDEIASYEELNVALNLKTTQLKEFVKSMNRRANVPLDTPYVTKSVFIDNFLETIEQASNFDPTPEDCEELFEQIALQQTGNSMSDAINLKGLYNADIMFFLSDAQVDEIVKGLKNASNQDPEAEEFNVSPRAIEKDARIKNRTLNFIERDTSINSIQYHDDEDDVQVTCSQTRINIGINETIVIIDKPSFIKHYPFVLHHVCRGGTATKLPQGVDIAFEDLSLYVTVGGQKTQVLDRVTGRLEKKTMTALMGGSGAGKTSLLNALCGRAFYGEVTGSVLINGHKTSIYEHMDVVGFVPQDDIVYAELTVRENLVFAGKFRLPRGTSIEEIEDLADEVMCNLGLIRVADSIVGDVSRRGVSGGEKKRVSIGLELMANPSILFLDEPTSGLDATSAMLVMRGLRTLVEKKGITVCSVIHQPRKSIFQLFDSMILLGVGGRMVYHGKVDEAEDYFENLGFELPPGESIADWLIDISSGRLDPTKSDVKMLKKTSLKSFVERNKSMTSVTSDELEFETEENEADKAKINRSKLYGDWTRHSSCLDAEERQRFEAPKPFSLPERKRAQPFTVQFINQLKRNFIVQKRNIATKALDTLIISAGVVAICLMDGKLELTINVNPKWRNEFELLTSTNDYYLRANRWEITRGLYAHVMGNLTIMEFAQKIGVVVPTLLAIAASKVLTEKRHELFREIGSGYNLNAFYLAVNISSTIEHTIQILFIALPAIWLRCTATKEFCMILSYIMMAWVCTSWSLFFPLCIPPKNVVLFIGFFVVFFGLLFSGTLSPTTFEDIYENKASGFISGMFSASRHFVETMLVSEFRALPPQSGFTLTEEFETITPVSNLFDMSHLAQHDMPEASRQSRAGWYQQLLPPFLVGLSIRFGGLLLLHICNRSQQARPTFLSELKRSKSYRINMIFLFCVIFLFIALVWTIN